MANIPISQVRGLPDPLLFEDGRPVGSRQEWYEKRKPELLELFRREIYGKFPTIKEECVSLRHVYTQKNMLSGKAVRKTYEISVKQRGREHAFNMNVFIPASGKAPFPVLLFFNIEGPWEALPSREEVSPIWPVEQMIARGYAAATVLSHDIAPDYEEGFQTGLYKTLDTSMRGNDSYGTISAWAWGLSRVMDCLEVDPDTDHSRVAVIGFSRGGKAVLWASAQDERFAMTVSICSGCTGAAIARDKSGEQIWQINQRFPYWFCGNYKKYNDNHYLLPVDQHMLLTLIAPRPLYIISKTFDDWADPQREFDSAMEASRVYRFLGERGLEGMEKSVPDEPCQAGKIAYHCQSGQHGTTMYDWINIMDFADRCMRGS